MKKNQGLYDIFINELQNMSDCENQIIKALPNIIDLCTSSELKDALSSHLEETENQLTRIKEIFSLLGVHPREKICEGIEGILNEGRKALKGKAKNSALDAA